MIVNLKVNQFSPMKHIISIFTFLLFGLSIQAQLVPADTANTDPSLYGQYKQILSKSKTLNGYKLVNPNRLASFWKSVRDTMSTKNKQVTTSNKKIISLDKEVSSLKSQITGTETSLANTNAKANEISFLGIAFTKSNYSMIVWSLIIILAIALAIVIIRSAKHIHESKYRSTLYEEISQEYQAYKTKANDKEKKLARELQDERNKLEELKNRN